MKTVVSPIVAVAVIAVVLLCVGLVMWQRTAGVPPGTGRRNTFDPAHMEKDPAKIIQGLKDLKAKEDAERSKR